MLCLASVARQTLRPQTHHPGRRRQPRRNDRTREGVLRGARPRARRHPAPDARSARRRRSNVRRASSTPTSSSFSTPTPSSNPTTTSSEPSRSSIKALVSPARAERSCRSAAAIGAAVEDTPAVRACHERARHDRSARRAAGSHDLRRGDHEPLSRGALPVPAAVRLSRPDGVLRHHHQPGRLRRRVPAQVRRAICSTTSGRSSATTSRIPRTSSSASRCSTRAIATFS